MATGKPLETTGTSKDVLTTTPLLGLTAGARPLRFLTTRRAPVLAGVLRKLTFQVTLVKVTMKIETTGLTLETGTDREVLGTDTGRGVRPTPSLEPWESKMPMPPLLLIEAGQETVLMVREDLWLSLLITIANTLGIVLSIMVIINMGIGTRD
jgi:hypothetical protein